MAISRKSTALASAILAAVVLTGGLAYAAHGWISDRLNHKGQGYITEDQYIAVKQGDSQQALASKFGPPLGPADIYKPPTTPASSDSCVFYQDDVPTIDGTIYRICFKSGLVTVKDGWGPLFDYPPLGPLPSSTP